MIAKKIEKRPDVEKNLGDILDEIASTAAGGELKNFAAAQMQALMPETDFSAFDFRVSGYWLTAHISHLSVFISARGDRCRKIRQEAELRFSFHSHHGCRSVISPNFGSECVHIPIYKPFPLDAGSLPKALGWLAGNNRGAVIEGAEKSEYFSDRKKS